MDFKPRAALSAKLTASSSDFSYRREENNVGDIRTEIIEALGLTAFKTAELLKVRRARLPIFFTVSPPSRRKWLFGSRRHWVPAWTTFWMQVAYDVAVRPGLKRYASTFFTRLPRTPVMRWFMPW